MAAQGDGHTEPYASEAYRQPTGGQSLKVGGHPEGVAGDGYGTAEGSNEDHSLNYGRGMRVQPNDHTRATAAGKPSRDKGATKDPFDTVPGTDGSPWSRTDPVYRRPGQTTQRP